MNYSYTIFPEGSGYRYYITGMYIPPVKGFMLAPMPEVVKRIKVTVDRLNGGGLVTDLLFNYVPYRRDNES